MYFLLHNCTASSVKQTLRIHTHVCTICGYFTRNSCNLTMSWHRMYRLDTWMWAVRDGRGLFNITADHPPLSAPKRNIFAQQGDADKMLTAVLKEPVSCTADITLKERKSDKQQPLIISYKKRAHSAWRAHVDVKMNTLRAVLSLQERTSNKVPWNTFWPKIIKDTSHLATWVIEYIS